MTSFPVDKWLQSSSQVERLHGGAKAGPAPPRLQRSPVQYPKRIGSNLSVSQKVESQKEKKILEIGLLIQKFRLTEKDVILCVRRHFISFISFHFSSILHGGSFKN